MGFNDYQRGDSEGYRGANSEAPKSFEESMGRAAGQARRDFELAQSTRQSEGYESIPPRYALYAIGLVALFALAGGGFIENLRAWLLLVFSIGALLLSRRLSSLLRAFTALYVGLWGGAAIGAFLLVMQGAPLTLGNIAIHLILGGMIGLVATVLLLRRRS